MSDQQPWLNDPIIQRGQGPMTIGTPDPTAPLQVPKVQGEIAAQAATAQGKQIDNRVSAATAPAQITTANVNAALAQQKLTDAQHSNQTESEKTTARKTASLMTSDTVLKAIKEAGDNIGPFTTGLPASLTAHIPGGSGYVLGQDLGTVSGNVAFDQYKQMKENLPEGAQGGLRLTDNELGLLKQLQGSISQGLPQDVLKDHLFQIEQQYRKNAALAAGLDPTHPEVMNALGIKQPPASAISPIINGMNGGGGTPPAGGAGGLPAGPAPGSPNTPWNTAPTGPGAQAVATGGVNDHTRQVRDERISSQVDAMINAGATPDQINGILTKAGHPEGIRQNDYDAARIWMANNPGHKYFGADISNTVPLTDLQKGASSPMAALIAHSANGLTAGGLGAVTGDQGRGALAAMAAMNPGLAAGGEIVGGAAGAGLGELAAAKGLAATLGANGARFAPRVADGGYGAVQGFNSAPQGSGIEGALAGGAAGLAGGYLGTKAVNGIGNIATGVTNRSVQDLRSAGVPLTVGQSVSQSGRLGAAIKKLEDAGTSIPGVGNMIDARRSEGIDAFNAAAFRKGGERINAQIDGIGQDGIKQLTQAKNDAYDRALGGVSIDAAHPQFAQDMGTVRQQAMGIPDTAPNYPRTAAMSAIDNRVTGAIDPNTAQISGRNFQEAYRGLARTGRERANGDYGYEVGQTMRNGQDALASSLETQNPGAFGQFKDANAAHRALMTLADAVNAGKATKGRFTAAQLNAADNSATKRLTGPLASASGDRPFYDLANAGQAVLPSSLGDSGTATRLMAHRIATGGSLAGLLTGGGAAADGLDGAEAGGGVGLTIAALLAAGGSKTAQRAMTKALLDRPALSVAIGNGIKGVSRVGGLFGTTKAASALGNYIGN